jgi:hypothetical protein
MQSTVKKIFNQFHNPELVGSDFKFNTDSLYTEAFRKKLKLILGCQKQFRKENLVKRKKKEHKINSVFQAEDS